MHLMPPDAREIDALGLHPRRFPVHHRRPPDACAGRHKREDGSLQVLWDIAYSASQGSAVGADEGYECQRNGV